MMKGDRDYLYRHISFSAPCRHLSPTISIRPKRHLISFSSNRQYFHDICLNAHTCAHGKNRIRYLYVPAPLVNTSTRTAEMYSRPSQHSQTSDSSSYSPGLSWLFERKDNAIFSLPEIKNIYPPLRTVSWSWTINDEDCQMESSCVKWFNLGEFHILDGLGYLILSERPSLWLTLSWFLLKTVRLIAMSATCLVSLSVYYIWGYSYVQKIK